jgi:hypothetical protein
LFSFEKKVSTVLIKAPNTLDREYPI